MVAQVPAGMVATYGQIAKLVGEPRRARYVGYALHVNPQPGVIPAIASCLPTARLAAGFAFGDLRRNVSCSKPRVSNFSTTAESTSPGTAGLRA